MTITNKLFEAASYSLKIGGRLVFLYYDASKQTEMEKLFSDQKNFRFEAVSENPLSLKFSRYLYTFVKIN